jgi:hypothetical protein
MNLSVSIFKIIFCVVNNFGLKKSLLKHTVINLCVEDFKVLGET